MSSSHTATFAEVRRNQIAALIQQRSRITVQELCSLFSVSSATIRNDLAELESFGFLKRTHGGAISPSELLLYPPLPDSAGASHPALSRSAAQAARTYIRPGDIIALDSGDATRELAGLLLDAAELTVVTNDIRIADVLLQNKHIHIILLGGPLHQELRCTVRKPVLDALSGMHFDTAFLTVKSISAQRGLSTSDLDLADVKKAMIAASSRVIALADCSAAERESFARFASLSDLDLLITDAQFPEAFTAAASESGVRILCAECA